MADQKKKLKKGDTITIIGRRWFEKVNGNTYHSVTVYVNGENIGNEPFTYGYSSHYLQTAREILEKIYVLPIPGIAALWHIKEYGINLIDSVSDVACKKDL